MQQQNHAAMLAAIPNLRTDHCRDFRQANGIELPVFAINLDRRPDRWEALTRRFAEVGFDRIARAPAVEGRTLAAEMLELFLRDDCADAPPDSHLSLVRPAVGCFLSHLSVWKNVAASGLPCAMILEDDAKPTPDFTAGRLAAALEKLPTHGILFPGCTVMGGLAEADRGDALVRVFYFNGTFCYVVAASACQYLLRHMLPMRMHVDHQLSHLLFDRRAEFPGLLMQPAAVQPDWGLGSDCHVDIRDETAADRQQQMLLDQCRRTLESEGRMLRPDDSPRPIAA